MLKDWRFWVCAALFASLVWLAGFYEFQPFRYHPAPYIYLFHAIMIFAWLSGLYCRWSGRWKKGDGRIWGGWVLLLAVIFQLPMCGVSFVSWALLGGSVIMGLTAIIRSKK